ncbi:protein CD300H-like [Sorex araneus]|uniref:protein CD300H-like n=1 Tax=Sorex araneus TaxID=42254 RepID=UPI00243386F4|nr:protein CD300H-like [Sorex araneus]
MAVRAKAMGPPSLLLLLVCVPGCVSLSGPSRVTGTAGGSLSLQYQYEEAFKAFNKYWCRQPCLPFWQETVETRGAGGVVRSGRVSITDHSEELSFTVTLENLTVADTGKYRCGVATTLQEEDPWFFQFQPFVQVQVLVSPASSNQNCTETPGTPMSASETPMPDQQGGSLLCSAPFLLLILLKVTLLLGVLGAVLWRSRALRPRRPVWCH